MKAYSQSPPDMLTILLNFFFSVSCKTEIFTTLFFTTSQQSVISLKPGTAPCRVDSFNSYTKYGLYVCGDEFKLDSYSGLFSNFVLNVVFINESNDPFSL